MNKPLVFLSHSKMDINFIRKLDTDLKRCKIETWLDEIDIQHGESWLKAIFEQGIQKCDFVLVYLTANTLKSKMVQTEIDSTLVNQLNEKNIKLLPYSDSTDTRSLLRIDLQALQTPVLNDENYDIVFPTIISNIWNLYLNKTVIKISKEKDLEIENLKLKNEVQNSKTNIMQDLKDEFSLFIDEYNYLITITYEYKKRNSDEIKIQKIFQMNMLFAFYIIYNDLGGTISEYSIQNSIIRFINDKTEIHQALEGFEFESTFSETFMDKLTIFGFVSRNFNPENKSVTGPNHALRLYVKHNYEMFLKSEKFDRFMLWLKLNKISIDSNLGVLKN